MIDWIQGFGEFIVGLVALGIVIVIFVGASVEIYDRFTEKDETDPATKARLKFIKDGEV